MKTYREGDRFPGEIGRTWEDSDPAFPMPPSAPQDAPNVLCVVVDDIGFGWVGARGYRREWLTADAVAGVVAACVVVPQAIAYAGLAGLPVQVGLYAALVPMVLYALFGSSRALSVSVTSTVSILTASGIAASGG